MSVNRDGFHSNSPNLGPTLAGCSISFTGALGSLTHTLPYGFRYPYVRDCFWGGM